MDVKKRFPAGDPASTAAAVGTGKTSGAASKQPLSRVNLHPGRQGGRQKPPALLKSVSIKVSPARRKRLLPYFHPCSLRFMVTWAQKSV